LVNVYTATKNLCVNHIDVIAVIVMTFDVLYWLP